MNGQKFWNWQTNKSTNDSGIEVEEKILFLNGVIAEDSWIDDIITPKIFKDELIKNQGDITVWINSPGGDCIAAAQIYNMLKEHSGNITIKVDGIAASAASVIAMAGDKILMSPTSLMMIHNPLTMVMGDSSEMKKAIQMLSEVKESIINAYELKTNLSRTKISNLMDVETWLNANKAVELGFADELMYKSDNKSDEGMMFAKNNMAKTLINKINKSSSGNSKPIEDFYKRLNLINK